MLKQLKYASKNVGMKMNISKSKIISNTEENTHTAFWKIKYIFTNSSISINLKTKNFRYLWITSNNLWSRNSGSDKKDP